MEACGVDILISAPQKGWSSSPCSGLVLFSTLARERIESTTNSSFACDLLKWLQIMEIYEQGGHTYHATMPTDTLTVFRNVMQEMKAYGFEQACTQQQELGDKVRSLLTDKGIKSVAAIGFQAPSVVVSYTTDKEIHTGQRFKDLGIQIAAGVPLRCDEPKDFQTFRIGLFGLDKLQNIDRTVTKLAEVIHQIF
jgi:aspartate aminotransferase-like enzyme